MADITLEEEQGNPNSTLSEESRLKFLHKIDCLLRDGKTQVYILGLGNINGALEVITFRQGDFNTVAEIAVHLAPQFDAEQRQAIHEQVRDISKAAFVFSHAISMVERNEPNQ